MSNHQLQEFLHEVNLPHEICGEIRDNILHTPKEIPAPALMCNSSTVCKPIHRQLFAPLQKSSPIHSCTYDQNLKALPLSRRNFRISITKTQT